MRKRFFEERKKIDRFLVEWFKNVLKACGAVFGVLGAISVIFPLADLTKSNFMERVKIFVLILIIVIVSAFIYSIHIMLKKSKMLYASGKTKIIFEYNDLKKVIHSNDSRDITIVVPIHSRLEVIGDDDKISKLSVHRVFYDFLNENNVRLDYALLDKAEKQMSNAQTNKIGRIGDWFLITNKEMGFETNIKFLLIEVNEVEEKEGGYLGLKALTKEEYVYGLLSLVKAICDSVEQEECIYIPLIGAGKANAAKPRDTMFLMEEILRFYKGDLRHEMHVIISEKDKKQGAEIYNLREII